MKPFGNSVEAENDQGAYLVHCTFDHDVLQSFRTASMKPFGNLAARHDQTRHAPVGVLVISVRRSFRAGFAELVTLGPASRRPPNRARPAQPAPRPVRRQHFVTFPAFPPVTALYASRS